MNEEGNWSSVESFHIDNDQLEGLSPQECFVLGIEWQMVAHFAEQPESFERPVHTTNLARLAKVLRKRGRQYRFDICGEDDTWRWLVVESKN